MLFSKSQNFAMKDIVFPGTIIYTFLDPNVIIIIDISIIYLTVVDYFCLDVIYSVVIISYGFLTQRSINQSLIHILRYLCLSAYASNRSDATQ